MREYQNKLSLQIFRPPTFISTSKDPENQLTLKDSNNVRNLGRSILPPQVVRQIHVGAHKSKQFRVIITGEKMLKETRWM